MLRKTTLPLLFALAVPVFEGKDLARPRIAVKLTPVAKGIDQPTDVQFLPGSKDVALIAEKEGLLKRITLSTGKSETLLRLKVRDSSEQGLLGIAFHPAFAANRKIYLHYDPSDEPQRSRISEFTLTATAAISERVILEVPQPGYGNHKAGALAFGPDGFLYVGFGDGGSGGDPLGNGQNRKTMLGKMLRIDVDRKDAGKQYAVPRENPFVFEPTYLPEIWALGLRNPWRFSFDPDGRLIVADVGQNLWEEIDLITEGRNYGWNVREGRHCFKPPKNCLTEGLTEPVYEYTRDDGKSITGGYVATDSSIPALTGKYVFGDYVSGRIWAASGDFKMISALGRWSIPISTFGRDSAGRIYVADFSSGTLYRIEN